MTKLIQHSRRPDLSFCRNGRIAISANASRILDLHPGDAINISVINNEYYLYIALRATSGIGISVARCFRPHRRSNYFRANSATLCRTILNTVPGAPQKAAFYVGYPMQLEAGDSVYLPIITRNPIIFP